MGDNTYDEILKHEIMNIYVGNLSYGTTDEGLREIFEQHGKVDFAAVIKDKNSGRSKGFGFVEMQDEDDALSAISALNGTEQDGRKIIVNKAKEREERDR
jgi:RNA recognition motif-containing protein